MREGFLRGLAESTRPLDLVAWAEAERIMPEGSPRPGLWRTDYMPSAREPMVAYCDPDCSEITVMSATQMQKSELLLCIALASVLEDPAFVLYVAPDKDLARAIAEDRFRPAAAAMPKITYATENKEVGGRRRGQSWGQKSWPGGGIVFTWSESRTGLVSRPIQRVLLDEVDRYVKTDVYESVRSRGVRFGSDFKLVSCSSPEDKLTSLIWRNYNMGSRGRYHGRCQLCGELDLFEWTRERIVWEQEQGTGLPIPESARYICGQCQKPWTDDQRATAIDEGEYVHEDDANRAHRSFWVNRLADKHVTLASIVEKNRKALVALSESADWAPLRRFKMDDLAEPWDDMDRMVSAADLNERLLRPRQLGGRMVISEHAEVIVVSVDVQDDRIELDIGAWGWHPAAKTARYWGLGYHKIYGEITSNALWLSLDKFLQMKWLRAGGREELGVSICVIDSQGHHQEEVKAYINARRGRPIYPLKGMAYTRNYTALRVPDKPSEGWGTKKLIQVGTNAVKDWIAAHGRADKWNQPGERVLEWYQTKGYDLQYFKGLVSEEKRAIRRDGKMLRSWQPKREGIRNEPLDLLVYSHAGMELFAYFEIVGFGSRTQAPDWKRFYYEAHRFRLAEQNNGEDVMGSEGGTVVDLPPPPPE